LYDIGAVPRVGTFLYADKFAVTVMPTFNIYPAAGRTALII